MPIGLSVTYQPREKLTEVHLRTTERKNEKSKNVADKPKAKANGRKQQQESGECVSKPNCVVVNNFSTASSKALPLPRRPCPPPPDVVVIAENTVNNC